MHKKFAIIDLGSNSVRLVMYDQDEVGSIREIDNIKSVLRLSAHVNREGEIDREGVRNTLQCLKRYRTICELRGIEKIYGVATAAIRQAANRKSLIEAIGKETGIDFRVLDGKEEAYYGYLATVNTMAIEEAITIDIGGGSTEITYFKDRKLMHSCSFPVGVVTLTRQYLPAGCPSPAEVEQLKQVLKELLRKEPWITGKGCPVIIMGGTARNLARIHQNRNKYSLSSLHHYPMTRSDVEQVLEWLRQMPLARRKEVSGLSKDRADIILAGLCVFLAVMETVQTDRIISSSKGLRDGLLLEIILPRHEPVIPDVLTYGTEQFIKRYRVLAEHAFHVAGLSVTLFDFLGRLMVHDMGEAERTILKTAAMLHDIGRSINIVESSKHTFYLIENVLLWGVTHRERLLIALAASYKSRKQLMKWAAAHSDILTKQDVEVAVKLGALLLFCRFLDRMQNQSVQIVGLEKVNKKGILQVALPDQVRWWDNEDMKDHLKKLSKIFGIALDLQIAG